MSTTETEHKHSFPVNDGTGSILNPGVCECGKTYARAQADRMLTEALEAVADAYGVPPRVSTHWAVAYGGSGNLNDGSGFAEQYDDEEDAREHLPVFYEDSRVVKRTVIALRWETVPGEEPAP